MSEIIEAALRERAKAIQSRADFSAFIQMLLQDFKKHPKEWENDTLESFLEGLSGFVYSMEGYYKNSGVNIDLRTPSWRVFADALLAARVYE